MIDPRRIAEEAEITWDEPPERLDYVREAITVAGSRARPVAWRGAGRRVGYAVLAANAERARVAPGAFERRVFWLADHDRDSAPDGVYATGAPAEAVDPRTVAPAVPGEVTDRAFGGRYG